MIWKAYPLYIRGRKGLRSKIRIFEFLPFRFGPYQLQPYFTLTACSYDIWIQVFAPFSTGKRMHILALWTNEQLYSL